MHSTKISGLAVDTEYTFHLVLRTSAGTYSSEKVTVKTHKMTDLSGVTITTGLMPAATKENLTRAVERIGAKIVDGVRIDTTHFVTTEGRGLAWEKAVENNIPVVRPEWVEACEKNGRILGVTKFYLDALRPGPPSEEQMPVPASVPVHKDLPSPPAENGRKEVESEPEPEHYEKARVDDSDEDSDEEQEQKVISTRREEQKVRLEEKDVQKVALRPGPSAASDDGRDDEDEPREKKKGGASPDGASFQDVDL
jgi:chitin biosynthesis protein CHS5